MGAYTKNVRVVNGGAYTKIVDTPLNLGTGGTIDHGATNPGSGTTGQLFFNTTDDKLYVWNGSAWVDVT